MMFLNSQVNSSTFLYITTQFSCQIIQDIELGISALSYTITSKREKKQNKKKKNPTYNVQGQGGGGYQATFGQFCAAVVKVEQCANNILTVLLAHAQRFLAYAL